MNLNPLQPPRRRRAATALEFAVACVVFFPFVFGIIEIGRGLSVAHILEAAVRKGCRTGIISGTSTANIKDAVKSVATNAGLSLTDSDITVLVDEKNVDASTAATGAEITVKVSLPGSRITWVPGGEYLTGNINSQFTLLRE